MISISFAPVNIVKIRPYWSVHVSWFNHRKSVEICS